jgi:hypothetical protein
MRRAADSFTGAGGNWARFAGNFMWQIRLEEDPDDSKRMHQVCYKYDYTADPVFGTDRQNELTFVWDAPVVGWPGVQTFGLNASRGLYARLSTCTPRNTGGFTVFRDSNPIFDGTGLQYGDVFGNEAPVFGYEVDGLSFTLDSDGLPRPTGEDGAPTDGSLEILALGLACNAGMLGDQRLIAMSRYGNATQESVDLAAMGNGMLVEMAVGGEKGGRVVHAGSTEWCVGLQEGREEPLTELITRNILDGMLSRAAEAQGQPGAAKL